MFKAMIMLCMTAAPTNCVVFEDTTGLKITEEACKVRAAEMAAQVAPMFPMPMTVNYKCETPDAV